MLAICAPAVQARTRHSEVWAREHFSGAERMREALNGRPPAERSRRDYQRVLNAYRSIYLGAPTSTKADPSVVAVAETLVEMGRRFDDDKILNQAIEQYKFLRREYPGSKYRFDGLFTIGEIYKDDLDDPAAARTTFQEFVRRYPHNRLAEGARQAIVELNQQLTVEKTRASLQGAGQKGKEKDKEKDEAKNASGEVKGETDNRALRVETAQEATPARSGRVPRVTGIRHWSTPDYTRVAIDLESDVKFSSQRIDSPARIFFDLRDTKLASTLVGKSFDVDDGFLKKVRVAQFAPGRTRVVLEVDTLSDYDAFLLPNPYRLIIDIHGKGRGRPLKESGAEGAAAAASASTAQNKFGGEGVSSPEEDTSEAMPGALEQLASARADNVAANGTDSGDDAKIAAPGTAPSTQKAQTAVVKKIVEADDDDDDRDAAGVTAGAGRGGPANPRRKAVGRTLASVKPEENSELDVHEARPTANGNRSLIRALGLKIGKIVIDPGHGGHDTGTIGPGGLEEKDLVLDVGRRLGKLLETRLGAEVVYTRKDDTFIPLETRTAVANQARADLFVSIHANSSRDPSARGVETYYLNFTSSPEALEVAARENAVSEKSVYELQDLVKKIALKEKIEESREFAGDVQHSLHSGLAVKSPAIRDRGVKKAPFIVLIGANMPSILAEISFVSNPSDEHRLETAEYRQRIAESLYRGIAKYADGLSGVKVASKMDKASGQ